MSIVDFLGRDFIEMKTAEVCVEAAYERLLGEFDESADVDPGPFDARFLALFDLCETPSASDPTVVVFTASPEVRASTTPAAWRAESEGVLVYARRAAALTVLLHRFGRGVQKSIVEEAFETRCADLLLGETWS